MPFTQPSDVDKIIREAHEKQRETAKVSKGQSVKDREEGFIYAGRYGTNPAPQHHLSSKGISADDAYRLIHDELALDGSTVLNFASFVHTWMPPQALKLVQENISKNLIDADEYPATQEIHKRCLSILADLWHAPSPKDAVGTATTGSSEAVEIGGLALKKRWQERMKKAGKNIHEPGPNIVMGANAQVALEKFARYFDVECRLVPVSKESRYCLDTKAAMDYVDENTIGVFAILGSTYTGHYEDVKAMSDLLDEYEKKTGIYVPIHVDAASGGFIAPFISPDLPWDFRLPRVVSINASGHKFGLTYVGVGWVLFRSEEHLPKELVFTLSYLGSTQYSFSLNFSRPAFPIIAQYFNLLHLGFEGYRAVMLDDLRNARTLSRALERIGSGGGKDEQGWFEVISDVHRAKGVHSGKGIDDPDVEAYEPSLPVVAFKFTEKFKEEYPEIEQRWVHIMLRAKGWIIPNYALAPNLDNEEILRVVVRECVTEVLVDRLIKDIVEIMNQFMESKPHGDTLQMIDMAHNKGARRGDDGPQKMKEEDHSSGTYNHPC
ncbi:glutamate decarboxylase [Coprinopsis cinerea AmutBmut pab1-1]|nr:glutamate decarboxylase [Coprinopsis cinerea AmutBmut pab1-1]